MQGIDLNTLLLFAQLIAVAWGGFKVFGKMDKNIAVLVTQREAEHKSNIEKFERIEKQLDKLGDVMIQMTKQETRLDAIDERLTGLQNKIEEVERLKISALKSARKVG